MNKMGKGGAIIIILVLAVAAFFIFKGIGNTNPNPNPTTNSQSTQGDLIRTVPLRGNGNFMVVYSGNFPGAWGAIVEDQVSAGCKFSNGKTTYKSVILGEGLTTQQIAVTGNNCTFSGNYNIISGAGSGPIKYFGNQLVN